MTVQNNYVLGLAALSLFASPVAIEELRNSNATISIHGKTALSLEFDQVRVLLSNPSTRDESTKAFLVMLMCTLTKDAYELTLEHARKANVLPLLQSLDWYHFCRIIRNCIAHNFLLEMSSRDISRLPISWRGRVITLAMNHRELPLQFFGYLEAWQLFGDIRTFAETSKI